MCIRDSRFEIVRALVAHDWERDEEGAFLRACVAHAVGQDYPLFPTVRLGAAVGSLNADEATRFAELVIAPPTIAFGADGLMRLDVAA